MTKEKIKSALEFMRREMNNSIWWEPSGLTRVGNPRGNPPDLTASEAVSVFHLLIQKDLLVPAINERKEKCFLLHHAKEEEWNRLIADIDKNWIQRNWLTGLKWIGVFLLWMSSIVISTYVSKNVEHHLNELNAQVLTLKAQLAVKKPGPPQPTVIPPSAGSQQP
jgi:hypothetical protein